MALDEASETTIMRVQVDQPGEACMVDQERWAEIRRLFDEERVSISEIGRRLDLDRKTVRRSLRQTTWRPYQRAAVGETLLTAHADFVQARAPQVGYSARIVYQELRASRGYTGSYETVKRWVAPLRDVQGHADRALLRFETPPGQQSQIDWGQALVPFLLIGQRVEVQRRGDMVHIFHRDREVATHPILPGTTNSASCPSTAPAPVRGHPANADPPGGTRPFLPARCRRSKCGIWGGMRRCTGARRPKRCTHEPRTPRTPV